MPDAAGSTRKLTAAERRARVVELRRQRWQFGEIGAELGITKQSAWEAYRRALAELPAAQVSEHRAEELVLADDAIRDLLAIACDHEHPRSVEAWNSIRGFMERKARILGLDAPSRIEVSDATDQAIRALEAELASGRVGELELSREAAAAGDAAEGEVGTPAP